MKLSIVIVNYNVRYFIEQALRSVFESNVNFDYDAWVVDNASSDGSVEMIKTKFPHVTLIESEKNLGFSGGNNLALRKIKSEFVLLLNPDTIISEDTLQLCIDKMDEDGQIGGLGVRMIDGGGHFLPESKRGLPTPFVAFCKAFGLSKLFPKSTLFNRYHLGHIGEFEESEIDILSGAFMLLRNSVLEKTGLLDESFFMYGEDIDLSYRIKKSGYKIWYYPLTSIVHFKGESTKKGSLNYVRIFYKAMIIFAKKHFVGRGAFVLSFLYRIAVVIRAIFSLIGGFLKKVTPVLLDAFIIFIGLRIMTYFWAHFYFNEPDYFSSVPLNLHHGIYTIFWLFSMYMGGVYDHYFSIKKLRKSLILGTLVLLVCFSLMSSYWRPSRAVLLLGSMWTMGVLSILRWGLGMWFGVYRDRVRLAIVGSQSEIKRSLQLMKDSRFQYQQAVFISPGGENLSSFYQGRLDDLKEVAEAYQVQEIVFCAKDIEHSEIIKWMTVFSENKIVRIVPEESASMIASRFKNKKGELYAIDARLNIAEPERRRQKRVFDFIACVFFLIMSPYLIFRTKGRTLLQEIIAVGFGNKTWVGYDLGSTSAFQLPVVRQPVLDIAEEVEEGELKYKMYYLYARDYRVWTDIELLSHYFF